MLKLISHLQLALMRKSRSRSKPGPGPKPTSKSLIRIPVTKGSLHGYNLDDKRVERRKILRKLAKKDTWETVVKRLNVLYIYNKNRHPEIAGKFRRDMKYIQKEFSDKFKRKSKVKSKKRSRVKRPIKRTTKRKSKVKSKKRSTKRKSKRRSRVRRKTA